MAKAENVVYGICGWLSGMGLGALAVTKVSRYGYTFLVACRIYCVQFTFAVRRILGMFSSELDKILNVSNCYCVVDFWGKSGDYYGVWCGIVLHCIKLCFS